MTPDHTVTPPPDVDLWEAVIEEVAAAEGIDPTELKPPMNHYIDVDAVTALCRHWQEHDVDGVIRFTYQDYQVMITSDRTVSIG